jgi:hypothetical protein
MASAAAFCLPSGFEGSGIQQQADAISDHPFQMNRHQEQQFRMAKLRSLPSFFPFQPAEQLKRSTSEAEARCSDRKASAKGESAGEAQTSRRQQEEPI